MRNGKLGISRMHKFIRAWDRKRGDLEVQADVLNGGVHNCGHKFISMVIFNCGSKFKLINFN